MPSVSTDGGGGFPVGFHPLGQRGLLGGELGGATKLAA